jgi:hypothetical protein
VKSGGRHARQGSWPRTAALAVTLVLFAIGCSRKPRPPRLQKDASVYYNPHDGFQFQVPAGWSENARADPRVQHAHEQRLVKYKRLAAKPAFLEVSVVDLPESTNVSDYLTEHSVGKEWQRLAETKELTVDRFPATQDAFVGYWDREKIIKEIVAVRQGKRVYFFTGSYPAADTEARDEIREAVASIVWTKDPGA